METDLAMGLGAYVTGVIIILLSLSGMVFLWLRHKSRHTPSIVGPFIRSAVAILRAGSGRWKSVGVETDTDLEVGDFTFCSTDCCVKAAFKARGQSASLVVELHGKELKLSYHASVLIAVSYGELMFSGEDWEVRCNEPLARIILDCARTGAGFTVLVQEPAAPKIYSKSFEKMKEEKARKEEQRRKRNA